ncbi:MAG: chromate transporter [Deltaproteobacteria bacterium]|nr:chromate transporter [Deltaproteobacteria bacterium]
MLWDFFLVTLKIGSLSFGGGYAMITPLHYDLVTRYGWLTESDFSSALAIGQITPGPLMIMVAFIGYKIAGLSGAILGTMGLFLPTALIVLAIAGSFMRFKNAPMIQGMMRGISLAVVGLLASVVIDLTKSAIAAPADAVMGIGAFAAVGPCKRDPIGVLLAAGFIRIVISLVIGI